MTDLKLLRNDLIEQFKNQPNIGVLIDALDRQQRDLFAFFCQLSTLLSIDSNSGSQLDDIGDIVALSREDAKRLATQIGYEYTAGSDAEDEMYRTLLKYKAFVNSADGTSADVINGLRMLWHGNVRYEEDPTLPATVLLGYDMFDGSDHAALLRMPVVKPAGVQVAYRPFGNFGESLKTGVGLVGITENQYSTNSRTPLPNYLCDEDDNLLCDGDGALLCEEGDDQ